MSCEGHFLNKEYTNNCLQLVNKYNTKISGIINQTIDRVDIHKNILSITPGVHLGDLGKNKKNNDNLGQNYRSINNLPHNPDIIVVGRAIYNNEDPCYVIDCLLKR